MGTVRRDAKVLESLQRALDAHAAQCGDPVRAILMSPFDRNDLDWDDFRGIPIESDDSLATGVVRIDCLTTTVQAAIREFRQALSEGEGAIAEAEIRLEAKLEALGQVRDEWWKVTRRPGWWREQANRAREAAAEERIRDAEDRIRAAEDQIRDEKRDSEAPENEIRAWMDAWDDMSREDRRRLDRLADGPDNGLVEPNDLPQWLVQMLRTREDQKPLRPFDQEERPVLRPAKRRPGAIRRTFRLVMRKLGRKR